MAFIRLKSRQAKFVSPEQGAIIWRVFNGEIKGTKKQREFVKHIERIYLNRNNAPDSYIAKYPDPFVKPKRELFAGQVRLPYID
jgi:hypothetical protein